VFTAALLLGLAGSAIGARGAQDRRATPPPAPAVMEPAIQPAVPPPGPAASRNVQVDVSVRLQGSPTAIAKQMTLVAADQTAAMGRAGLEVPVATTQMVGDNKIPMTTYNYRSVGLNVDARPRILDAGRVMLMLKLNFNSVLKATESDVSGRPSFSSAQTEINVALESGKALIFTQASDAELGRGYTVEVKATILK
jgi:hypothetical protein